jgi:hypothetical protein
MKRLYAFGAALLGILLAAGIYQWRSKPEKLAVVSVYDDGAPYADRWVVFHDADGTVRSSGKSDALGKISGAVQEGGMVTVAYGSSIRRLVTVVGLKPADSVLIGEKEEDEAEAGNTLFRANVKLPGPRPEAARYSVSLGVAESEAPDPSQPLALSVLERFVKEGRFAVLAEAIDRTGEPIAHAFTWATAADAGEVPVTLPSWSTEVRTFEASLLNLPQGVRRVRGDLGMVTASSNRFHRPSRSVPVPGESTLRFLVPAPLGDDAALRIEAIWDGEDKAGIARRQHVEPAMKVDLAAELLPRVSGAHVAPSADPARPTVAWSVAGPSSADVIVVRLKWPATGEHEWTILLPPTTRDSFRLPALPQVLASWRPDARPIAAAVGLVDSSEYANYDDVRAKGIDIAAEGLEDDEEGWLRWSTTGDLTFY